MLGGGGRRIRNWRSGCIGNSRQGRLLQTMSEINKDYFKEKITSKVLSYVCVYNLCKYLILDTPVNIKVRYLYIGWNRQQNSFVLICIYSFSLHNPRKWKLLPPSLAYEEVRHRESNIPEVTPRQELNSGDPRRSFFFFIM